MPSKINKKEAKINRRRFLKETLITGTLAVAGSIIPGYLFYSREPVRKRQQKIFTFKDFRTEHSLLSPEMVIARGAKPAALTRAAVEKLGGISRFIKSGDRVLIKPNVGWDRQPEQAANTHPAIVETMVRLCFEAGARDVWVTDISINDLYRSFARSGIESAVVRAGGKVRFTGESDFVLTDLRGEILKIWPVSALYHKVDKLINIPIVKHHSLSKCTIAMKNWYGVLGGRRNRLHQKIDASIADLAFAIRPTLTIVDATRVLMRNGPTGGNLDDVSLQNTIVAGVDQVAVDSFCLNFLNLKPDDIPFLQIAEKRGVGVTNWKSLRYKEIKVG